MEKIFLHLYLTLLLGSRLIILSKAQLSPIGCYKVDKGYPTFIPAGNYDPDDLGPTSCLEACTIQDFNYAALEDRSCLCSDTIYPDSAKQINLASCTKPCSGNPTESCGTTDYSLVYDAEIVNAVVQLNENETATSYVVGISKSATLAANGTDLKFRFYFGDDEQSISELSTNQQQPHNYALPGQYVLAATGENLRGSSTDAVSINVEMTIDRYEITCPIGVEVDEVFTCTLEVYEGSTITASFDINDGSVTWQTFLGSPSFVGTGTCLQSVTLNDGPAANTAWVIPRAEFLNEGRVIAFEAHMTFVGDGQLDFLILRPSCSGNDWCPTSNTCVAAGSCSWVPGDGNPLSFDKCSSSDRYCSQGKRCVAATDIYTCPAKPARMVTDSTDPPLVNYKVVTVITRTVVSTGYNWLKLEDIATRDLPVVQVGDVLGFKTTTSGARIGYDSINEDSAEFEYTSVSVVEGGTLPVVEGGTGIKNRHHIKAITATSAMSVFYHSFDDIGNFPIDVGLTNPLTTLSVTVSTRVGVQSRVLDLILDLKTPLVEIENMATVTARVSSGNPVNYTIDWGDGTIRTVSRVAESFDQPDNLTHKYGTQDGYLTINVTASNLLGSESQEVMVMVQRPVIRSTYTVTSNSPQIHPCYPCQTQGIIRFTVTLDNPGDQLMLGTLPTMSISSGTYGNTTGVRLTGLVNHGDTVAVEHLFRFPGNYDIYYKIYNLVSTEDYFFGQVSIHNRIVGFTAKALYRPPLAGEDELVRGNGPAMDLFPVDSPVSLVFETINGTGITVKILSYDDSTPAAQRVLCNIDSVCKVSHKYAAAGTYTISVEAANDISGPFPASIPITLEDNVKDVTVSDINKVAAGELKEFEVEVGSGGATSCLLVDYIGDERIVNFFGDPVTCSSSQLYDVSLWVSAIPIGPFTLSHIYDDNGSYQLKIRGFNAVSDVHIVHAFAITDLDCAVPEILIEDHHSSQSFPKKYLTSNPILLEVITDITCVTTYNMKRWKVQQVAPGTGTEVFLDDLSPSHPYYVPDGDTTAIRFPARTFPIGIYKFTFVMTFNKQNTNNVEISNSVSQFVEIEPAPLIIRLIEGETTSSIVGAGETLHLQPGWFSIDPNIPEGKDPGFDKADFKYFCYRFYENLPLDNYMNYDETPIEIPAAREAGAEDKGGCYFTGPGRIDHTAGTLLLNTTGMLINMTHEIMVIVNKDGLEGKGKLKFTVKEGRYPQPTVRCSNGTLFKKGYGSVVINPTSDLRLSAYCRGCDGNLTKEWAITVYNRTHRYDLPDWQQHATGFTTNNLYLNKRIFSIYPNAPMYEVTVLVTNEDGQTGKSHVLMEPNQPPTGGLCSIVNSQTSLISGETIDVSCVDWADSNGIQQIRYFVQRDDYYIPINLPILRSSGNVVTIEPPVGSVKLDYKMDLKVEISDKLGAVTSYRIAQIKVHPNSTIDVSDTEQARLLHDEIQLIISKGNSREITSKFLTIASSLNDQRDIEDIDLQVICSTNNSQAYTHASLTREGDIAYRAFARVKIMEMSRDISLDSMENVKLLANSITVCSTKTDELSQRSQVTALIDVVRAATITKPMINSMKHWFTTDEILQREIMVEQAQRMMDQVEVFGNDAPEDLKSATMYTILDNLGNNIEGVHYSSAAPLSMVDKQEADGGDFRSLKQNIDEGRGSSGSITTTWPTKTAAIDEELRDRKIEKARKIANNLHDLYTRAQRLILKNKLPLEPESVYKCDTMTSRVARGYARSILNQVSYVDQNGGPTFPSADDLFENSELGTGEIVDAETSSFRKNPRNFDESSEALSENTEVQNVGFVKPDGSPVSVINLKKPVLVKIARPKVEEPEMPEFDPANNTDEVTGMSCHSFNVSYERLSVTLEFVPYNFSVPYELFIQYNEFPTEEVYDLMFSFNNGSELYDSTTERYTIFLDDKYIANNTGQYFVCIRELGPFESSDYFSFDKIYNITGNFTGNYSMRIVQTGCRYWDEDNEVWSSEGTEVDPRSNHEFAYCLTTHLSSFASAWIVPPTPLDFNYIFANADFADNLTIYITTIAVYVIFFFIFIWARRKDKKDILLLGVTPLPDNNPKHKYMYEIVVCTGQRKESGTESKVSFILSGDNDETEVRSFEDNMRPILRRSAQDRFLMATPRPLGTLNYMRVWHDNTGKDKKQSWYLQYIAIRDLQTRERYYFIVNEWFSLVEGDGQIDRLIPIAGKEQMQSFGHVFYGHSRKNLSDGHIWFSIFARPAGSRFTRLQRAGCCMMLLWLEMLVNIMWYKVVPPAPATRPISFGPFSLSPAQISIGVQSAVIVFPVSLLVVQLFRKARVKNKRISRIELAKKEQHQQIKLGRDRSKAYLMNERPISASAIQIEERNANRNTAESTGIRSESDLNADDSAKPNQPKFTKKKKSTFPWWTIIIAWIVVILSTVASTTFTIFYGIQMGNLETSEWLTSLVITFFTGILLTQPIKVIALATFIALVIKTPNADEDDDMDDDEEEFALANDEEWLHHPLAPPYNRRKITYRPPDSDHIERMREKRVKELEMYSIIREIILYIIFLFVLMIISYGNIDPHSYIMKQQYSNTLVGGNGKYTFDKVKSIKQFWLWVHTGLVPNIYAGTWYNGDNPKLQDHFFGDRNSFIVGYPVMRQVRIKPDLCKVNNYFEGLISECNVGYSISNEDEASYEPGWIPTNSTSGFRKEYTYSPWSQLDGYPFIGRHAVYIGGGYVVEMKDKANLADHMQRLYREAWIDRYTRAVFIEFSTYNAQVNLFAVVNLVVEFLPLGGAFTMPRIDIIRLLTYYEGFALVQVCCEAIFFIFILFFIVKETRNIKKEKREYPKKFWNIAEWLIIGFSIGVITVYFYRFFATKTLLSNFKDSNGRGYVKLQYVAYWNELLGYMLGWVVFMATLKFLKLLRFNRRMGVLSSTIRYAFKDLVCFGIFFGIIFFGFSIIFYLILGKHVHNYSDFIFTLESLITAILGKFAFKELVEAERVLGPLLFFLFMGSIAFILINMFLTIISDAFQVVKRDIEKQSNDYEMVDFMIKRFKAFIGLGQESTALNPKEHEARAAVEAAKAANKDTFELFPDKVDQLLNQIARVYFNHDSFDDFIKAHSRPKNIVPITV